MELVDEKEFGYLCGKRIEINSVKSKVGTEKLWEWIIYRLEDIFPNRNYNRAIDVPKVVKPDDLMAFYTEIENGIESYLESESCKISNDLTDIEGFIDDVPHERIDIEEKLKDVISDNQDYQDIMNRLNELLESHPFFNGRDETSSN